MNGISFSSRIRLGIPAFFILSLIYAANAANKELPVYQSSPFNPATVNAKPEQVAVNYDKKAHLMFGTAYCDTVFFVRVIFLDKNNFMKLVRGGIFVYFDPEGKKKKSNFFKLERYEWEKKDIGKMPDPRTMKAGGQRDMDPVMMITRSLMKATWTKKDQSVIFDRNMKKDPIRTEFLKNDQDQLVFELELRMSEMPLVQGQKQFSIGIETGDISEGFQSGGARGRDGMPGEGGNMGEGSRGGGGGSGMPGGRMGGPGGGRGGSGPTEGSAPDTTPMKLWFMVAL
jgi:hypothetical protein